MPFATKRLATPAVEDHLMLLFSSSILPAVKSANPVAVAGFQEPSAVLHPAGATVVVRPREEFAVAIVSASLKARLRSKIKK